MYRFGTAMLLAAMAVPAVPAAEPAPATKGTSAMKIAPDIEARRRLFVTKPLAADLSALAPGDREAIGHLANATKLLHAIFMQQIWSGNREMARKVAALEGPLAAAAKDYYRIMGQPWDKLKHDEPFLGDTPRPPGAGFYPEDMTREEFEKWITDHETDKQNFLSPVRLLERHHTALAAVRYGKKFKLELGRIVPELRAAARTTSDKKLARFLELRADALLSDDYFASDMAWMDLDGAIEFVFGPYETYDDALFGYKASYEAFLCVTAPADSARLAKYKEQLPFLEKSLPIPDEHKNLKRGSESPIRVSDVILASGDARSGVQTVAFNLPNDERVREAKGSKKVLLKNMMQAKYDAILVPIAGRVLPAAEASKLDFDSFFHFILFHEMSHGLGPGRLTKDGRETEVRLELRDLYSAIEEAKADALGVWDLYTLADRGVIAPAVTAPLPWTVVAGLFRTARFGVSEAHGLGVVLQTNFLLEKGAIEVTPDGRYRPVPEKFRAGIEALAHELLMVEANADYEKAKQFVARYGTPPASMMTLIHGLDGIPVDVDPYYTLFEKR